MNDDNIFYIFLIIAKNVIKSFNSNAYKNVKKKFTLFKIIIYSFIILQVIFNIFFIYYFLFFK